MMNAMVRLMVWGLLAQVSFAALTASAESADFALDRWLERRLPQQFMRRELPYARSAVGLPIFRGFESPRYQQHDELIVKLTSEFNANKAKGCGGTIFQASQIPNLSPALVKAQMIEESGGRDAKSLAAWAVDPLQVNVPGDWVKEKILVGLTPPAGRNEGTAELNIRAAIRYLSRKGFTVTARPAADRPGGYFDGWQVALMRYNGRRDRTDADRRYSEAYAEKIILRARYPRLRVPIGIH